MLLTLYGIVVTYDDLPHQLKWQVQNAVKELKRTRPPLTEEQRLLAIAILRSISVLPRSSFIMLPTNELPDTRAIHLYAYTQQQQEWQLTKPQVEEVLAACTDTRRVPEGVRKKVGNAYSVWDVAWNLLEQQFGMAPDALEYVVQRLDDDSAMVCAAAALLLRKRKELTPDMREEAMRKIMAILADGERSRRPLETPDSRVWRLDDVLFETLGVLAG